MFQEEESFHILKETMGLFLGEEEEKMFLIQPGLWGGYLGKSPIMFYIHISTLSTKKQYLNRDEEVIMPT